MENQLEINYKRLGATIKEARKLKQMTQEELAEKTNLSPTHISNIETGKAKVSLVALLSISNELGYSIDNFLDGNIDNSKVLYGQEFSEKLKSCTHSETRIILDVVDVLKKSLKQNRNKKFVCS
jgi:transcriptional regulator with XRE-family HTH domain